MPLLPTITEDDSPSEPPYDAHEGVHENLQREPTIYRLALLYLASPMNRLSARWKGGCCSRGCICSQVNALGTAVASVVEGSVLTRIEAEHGHGLGGIAAGEYIQ